jgi:Raf kinase inhibitor-like YbhB/YbcL family protein
MGFALSDMQVTSSAFKHHGKIPAKYSGEGANVSPPLAWTSAPDGTQSFAVICHDPDAPLVKPGTYGFAHWVLYNLPASTVSLEEDTREGTPGRMDFDKTGYGGPMPPEGHGTHHYYFLALALDRNLDLEPGLTLEEFLQKAEPHVIGMNRLVGTYKRG